MSAPYQTLELAALRRRRSAKWAKYPPEVLPAWIAEMDYPLPEPVRDELRAAVDRDDTGYVHDATVDLGGAVSAWAARRFGWQVDPACVVRLPDVMSGVEELLRLLTAPGDGVVVNPPVYPPFFSTIEGVERRVLSVPLLDEGEDHGGEPRWRLDLDGLERAFAAGARTYLLCNPHNPSGRAFTRDELAAVAALCERYDVTVVSDEIHAPLVLPGAEHVPWVSLGGHAAERGVVLVAASKAYDIAGLKCAVAVAASPRMREVLARIPEEVGYRASILGAIATEAALRPECDAWLDGVLARLDANRRLIGELVAERLPGVRWSPPEASYLAWFDCRPLGLGDDPAETFLERGRVALGHGPDFGDPGRGWARLTFATSAELVREAIDRMATALPPRSR